MRRSRTAVVSGTLCTGTPPVAGGTSIISALYKKLMASRKPPIAPPVFEAEMKQKVADGSLRFTSPADMGMVIKQYRIGFIKVFERDSRLGFIEAGVNSLWYKDAKWGVTDAKTMLYALKYAAAHCRFLDGYIKVIVGGNHGFEDDDVRAECKRLMECEFVDKFVLGQSRYCGLV